MSQVSLGRPEFVPGTPPGHPDRQIPLCEFSLSVFFTPYPKGPDLEKFQDLEIFKRA